MLEDEPITKTTITLPTDLYWRWQNQITARRLSQKQSAIDALEQWITGPRQATNVPRDIVASPEERQWLDRLLSILRSSDEDVIDDLKGKIDALEKKVALSERPKRKHKQPDNR